MINVEKNYRDNGGNNRKIRKFIGSALPFGRHTFQRKQTLKLIALSNVNSGMLSKQYVENTGSC